jgi:hypothetical protein
LRTSCSVRSSLPFPPLGLDLTHLPSPIPFPRIGIGSHLLRPP